MVATNVETGVALTAQSNESGSFLVPFLLPGKYKVTASQTGFKTWSRDEIELRVNDALALEIRLEVGALAETVEVPAGAPPLETADSSVGKTRSLSTAPSPRCWSTGDISLWKLPMDPTQSICFAPGHKRSTWYYWI